VLTTGIARTWISRWDRQQEGYHPDREERFTAVIDAVEAGAGRSDPLVLDLGCGPGSLSARLLDRLPDATVVAIDTDPLLLALGRGAESGRPGLRFTDLDLGTPGWAATLGLDRPADAAVSTTALHWLDEAALRTAYAEVASVLRPGGLLLNCDQLTSGDATPELLRLEQALSERDALRRLGDNRPEDWSQWWEAAAADPALAGLIADRTSGHDAADHHGSKSAWLDTHVAALRAAGFGEVGTLWQHGDSRLLCGVRG
jgi:SAM-dependent methyltransferase